MKEPIFKDQGAIEHQLSELEQKVNYIQGFVDKYNDLGIGKLQGNELLELFQNTKEFISKKITGGDKLKIDTLTMNPEKLLEIIEKPKGLDELLVLIENHNSSKSTTDFYRIEAYSIEDDKVVVSNNTIHLIEENNTVYLENNKQKDIYMAAQGVIDNLNKLKDHVGGRLSINQIEQDIIKRGARNNGEPSSDHAEFVLNFNIIRKFK